MSAAHWPAAALVDERRLDALVTYCPLCRRPSSTTALPPLEALRRVARHVVESHDIAFGPLLRAELDGALRASDGSDPFCPTGESW